MACDILPEAIFSHPTSESPGKIFCSTSMMVSLEKDLKDTTKSFWFDLKDVA